MDKHEPKKTYKVSNLTNAHSSLPPSSLVEDRRKILTETIASLGFSLETYQVVEAVFRQAMSRIPTINAEYEECVLDAELHQFPVGKLEATSRLENIRVYIKDNERLLATLNQSSTLGQKTYGLESFSIPKIYEWSALIKQYEHVTAQIQAIKDISTDKLTRVEEPLIDEQQKVENLIRRMKQETPNQTENRHALKHETTERELKLEKSKNFEKLINKAFKNYLKSSANLIQKRFDLLTRDAAKIFFEGKRQPKAIQIGGGKHSFDFKIHPYFKTYTIVARIIYGDFLDQLWLVSNRQNHNPEINAIIASKLNLEMISYLDPNSPFTKEEIKNKKNADKFDSSIESLVKGLELYDKNFLTALARKRW